MNRRSFLKLSAAASLGSQILGGCASLRKADEQAGQFDLYKSEATRVLARADAALDAIPGSVTAARSPRSAGGEHDYFSEGDYWWADPDNPDGPYIQRDGMSNPDNFNAHRLAMIRLSRVTGVLAAAHRLSGEGGKYAVAARRHLRVWFLDEATRMRPHLLYAQAIKGRFTGRGTGIIDTIHLAEVAQAIGVLGEDNAMPEGEAAGLRQWFGEYLGWINSHQYGKDERAATNNHATCWVMQAGAFARLVGDEKVLEQCRELFVHQLLQQVEADGSFPRELGRTKPYCYSLFNLDNLGMAAHILSTSELDLWRAENDKGAGLRKAMEFHYPYIADKGRWPYGRDVMYFDLFPVRMPALLFGGLALGEEKYIELWKGLDGDPTDAEVIRNYPVRQPVLWVGGGVKGGTVTMRRGTGRKKWTEEELLRGITPEMCGPDLVGDRVGREMI